MLDRLPALGAILFELAKLSNRIPVSKTAFSDLANLGERSERIEQIQQRRVRRAKLTGERIR
jgi:hypothetical protein